MAKPARVRIAQLLRGAQDAGSFSVEWSTPAEGVTLSVEGIGLVRLPVGAAQERSLVSVARPARFGIGEETLTDTSVRDTWEITAEHWSLGGQWERILDEALAEVHDGLGLPAGARLRAEPHALLVYGPDQFFLPHQDSEKDDEMVATLVVSLPSVHTGGELVVTHGAESRSYRHGDRNDVGFVAFYADCIHEVRPIRSGRRVTLTFNLLVTRETESAVVAPGGELADLLTEHFATPAVRRWSERALPPPYRLVLLLDHQYSERGLTSDRLKGRDVESVSRLRAAADRTDCVTAMALAEVKQTWSAYVDRDSWRYGYPDDDSDGQYDVGELIDDSTTLGWWKRAGVDEGEPITLTVDETEICEVTPTSSLSPYQSEYEGFMGNYGNTLDRWYRRAAIVIWPKDRDFIARADGDLSGAVAELEARLKFAEDLADVREDARDLIGILGPRRSVDPVQLMAVADGIDDAELAHALLTQIAGEGLTTACAAPLGAVCVRYGDAWTRSLVDAWFPAGAHRPDRREWVQTTLPDLSTALTRLGAESVGAHLCRRMWAGLTPAIDLALTMGPGARAESLASLVPAAAAIFNAADAKMRGSFVAALMAYQEGIRDLEIPLLRRLGRSAPPELVADATSRLKVLIASARAADDWSIAWTGCGCELCLYLEEFLADSSDVVLDWPLRTDRRQHVHRCIDQAELPIVHRTIRKGSPFVLRLSKLADLHEREAEVRRQAAADLQWLLDGS